MIKKILNKETFDRGNVKATTKKLLIAEMLKQQ
jgi:hypothetical protein